MFENRTNHYFAALALGASLLAFGMGANAACVKTDDGTGVHTEILYAGQTIEAGTVTTQVVGTDLTITYETSGGWQLQETHTWVGDDLTNMPQTRQGNPKIGNFPYQSGDVTGSTSYSVSIPLGELGFYCPSADQEYLIAAHAAVQLVDAAGDVIQTETAWSDGDRYVARGMWGTYSTVTLTCNCEIDEQSSELVQCETAFAYSGGTNLEDDDITQSFLDIDVDGDGEGDFNRWGWSNGEIGAGNYSWDIYAGAGQSDITKGTWVGTLTVEYDGATAIVWFEMNDDYYMNENHLYVGSEILPRDVNGNFTVAPGQYPTIHENLNDAPSDSYKIEGLSGDIYVVAHANVCGF